MQHSGIAWRKQRARRQFQSGHIQRGRGAIKSLVAPADFQPVIAAESFHDLDQRRKTLALRGIGQIRPQNAKPGVIAMVDQANVPALIVASRKKRRIGRAARASQCQPHGQPDGQRQRRHKPGACAQEPHQPRIGTKTLLVKANISSPFWLVPVLRASTRPQPGRDTGRLPVQVVA